MCIYICMYVCVFGQHFFIDTYLIQQYRHFFISIFLCLSFLVAISDIKSIQQLKRINTICKQKMSMLLYNLIKQQTLYIYIYIHTHTQLIFNPTKIKRLTYSSIIYFGGNNIAVTKKSLGLFFFFQHIITAHCWSLFKLQSISNPSRLSANQFIIYVYYATSCG